jgi:two-component system copper resistance phosphate regulon response regulator CusR
MQRVTVRILIIEDDLSIADFLSRGLREEGYTVAHAADGAEGLRRLVSEWWDIILLDCWIPKIDGLAVLRQFRQRGGTSPVLLLTARDSIADRVEGLDSGADDYLCKPFSFAELLARIRSLLRRQLGGPQTRLTFENIELDLVSQQAQRDGRRLDLTAKQQLLLSLFLQHPEETLTREFIYGHVWDESYDGSSNTLEVHIKELRRELERHGPRVVHTMRGRGYVLSAKSPAELVQA